jgi:hypothetical protein
MVSKATLLSLSCVWLLGGCGGTPVQPQPSPECRLDTALSFAPAAGSQAMQDLETARKGSSRYETLTGDDLVLHCQSRWQNIVEHLHCPAQLNALCDKNCPNSKCKEPPHSEAIMKRCRTDTLPVFTAEYPLCQDYKLCNAIELEPNSVECKKPS